MTYEKGFFKKPKTQIKKLKDEYETRSDEKLRSMEELKNFTEMAEEVFKAYEEMSGRRVNREPMKIYLYKYFDEGFEVDAIVAYLKMQIREPFFQENPTAFSIANLFPKDNPENFQRAWDKIEFARVALIEAGVKKTALFEGLRLRRKECGHTQSAEDFRAGLPCEECPKNELACLMSPYEMMSRVETDDLRSICFHFMRQNEESLLEYAERTWPLRKQIYEKAGVKGANPAPMLKSLSSKS